MQPEQAHLSMRSWSSAEQPCTSPTMMSRPLLLSSAGSTACTGDGSGKPAARNSCYHSCVPAQL